MNPENTDPMRSIVETLLFYEAELQGELRYQRERADAAERRLSAAEHELAALRTEVLQAGHMTRQIAHRLTEGLQEYLDETEQAQRTLVSISRRLLERATATPRQAAVGDGTAALDLAIQSGSYDSRE